jgi:ketol-acid reductoisomerase
MVHVYYDADADLALIQQKAVAVIGYGNQGRAHALNLKDNHCNVVVGSRAGSKNREKAEEDGLPVMTPLDAARWADVIMLLAPDENHREVFERDIAPGLVAGNMLLTAHGFSLHYSQILPPADIDVALVAPKGPGSMLRQHFVEGNGLLALWSVYQNATGYAEALALSYACAIGCTRAGVLQTTVGEETETDLFGEQTVLCGGITALIRAAFETLVDAGYQPEVAYIECMHEVKLVVDLLYRGGLHHMHESISDTAEYGDYVAGPRIVNGETREEMRHILRDIQSGNFARNWILENLAGRPSFYAMRHNSARHPIEHVGRAVRALVPSLRTPAQS